MRRITAAALVLMLIFSFAACKKAEKEAEPSTTVQTETDAGEKAAEENKDILSEYEPEAEIFEMPAVSVETIKDYTKDSGAKSVTVNKDGTVDVDMTDEEYAAMMEKISKTILDKLEGVRQSSSMIESVQTGLDFDKFYIFVDKAAYEADPDAIDIQDCCESAEVYQMLGGKKTKDIKLTLYIMNKDDDLEIARKVYTVAK